ncbi:MAG: PPOX class F420-dependent oxidoreductase [Pseudomonadota bacterium]
MISDSRSARIAAIEASRYLSLTTFRRTGAAVPTPVWFARLHDGWFAFSAGTAGKIKRLRHTSRVLVAPCSARGRIYGETVETRAELIDDTAAAELAYAALRARYGWQMTLLDWLSSLSGRRAERQVIKIVLPD